MDYRELLEAIRSARHYARVRGWREREINRELRRRESPETKLTSGQGCGTSRAEREFPRHTDPCRPHACARKKEGSNIDDRGGVWDTLLIILSEFDGWFCV